MNNDSTDEIRLSDMLVALVKHKALIGFLTLAGLIIGIIASFVSYAMGEVSKEYAVTTSIAVTSQYQDGRFTTQNVNPNSTDIYLAENMVDSVIYVLKSDKLLNKAINDMGLVGIPASDISSHMSLAQFRETQIIEITLYWRSSEEGVRILKAINEVAPEILVDTLKIGSVSVVNEPMAKYRVGGRLNFKLWLLIALGGFVIGAAISVCQMLFFPTLVAVEDVENRMGRSMIGTIPSNQKYFARRRSPLSEDLDRLGPDVRESYAVTAHILQNRLKNSDAAGSHCLYVTSASSNEGKTVTAANIAAQLASQEHKVLLVDLDVKNPTLGGLFLPEVAPDKTINALYRKDERPTEVITHLNGYLDLLPAVLEDRELPLDEELLGMVQRIAADYEYVLIDTAPVGSYADTLNINRIAEAALFVIRYDKSTVKEIEDVMTTMDKSGVIIEGCIVSDVKFGSKPRTKSTSKTRREKA